MNSFQSEGRIKNLSIASISDIHFGNKKNTTSEIIKNLELAFPDNAETASLNLIFICGDVFDSLLYLNQDDIIQVKLWIAKFLRMCAKNKTLVRILEGTPSHDWGQSKLFLVINEIGQINADVKHITKLSIESIQIKGNLINVLYVPDEWDENPDNTYQQVLELLEYNQLSKVDFAIMHGNFAYQLPDFIKTAKHNENHYLSIVNECIFIGHIHTPSSFKNIYAQGSFDRLRHGEEEAKGHIRLQYDKVGKSTIKFIENKTAKIFKTITCYYLDVEAILLKLKKELKNIPLHSHIRIEAEKTNPIFSNMEVIIRDYPLLIWSKLAKDQEEKEVIENIIIEEETFVPITITRDNIVDLVINRLSKNTHDSLIDRSKVILSEVI